MLEVKSFFKKNNTFILCEKYFDDLKGGIDSEYEDFEGALELIVNGKYLIDKSMWDYIDQLWRIMLDGLASICLSKHYVGYFPDQAIEIMFINMNDIFIEVRVDTKVDNAVRIVYDKEALIRTLLDEAEIFFKKITELLPNANLDDDFKLIDAIRNKNIIYLNEVVSN